MTQTSRQGGVVLLSLGLVGSLTACHWLRRPALPPPAPGVVLVLARGFEPGGDLSRTPALRRMMARGRSFESAFAPDPSPASSRRILLHSGSRSLAEVFRSRGGKVAVVGSPSGTEDKAADLALTEPFSSRSSSARLEDWLRRRKERFLAIVAIGPPAAAAPAPAAAAGEAPELPRVAVDDLGFGDRPGVTVRPPVWSPVARRRAEAELLERSLEADRALQELTALVDRAAPGAAMVVLGDPPADLGAHGLVARPGLFDDTLRSTLVMATPGLSRAGHSSPRLVSTGDLAPTLLELAGLGSEPGLPGRSLMPLLADANASWNEEVLSSAPRTAPRLGRTARSDRWRYTEWPDGSRELYDHVADPGEHVNLAGREEQRATIEAMQRVLYAGPGPPSQAPDARRASGRPRNVLLVILDDLNTRVGSWGAPVQTPNIDRLASRGVRFDRAYVPVAMCSPSRSSVLTGWAPERTGVWNNQDPPRPQGSLPLEEYFSAHGSVTVAIGKVQHFPENFRWDVREEHPLEAEEAPDEGELARDGLIVAAPGGDLAQADGRRARRAAALIERYRRRSFFLALGLVRPHTRWIAPARYFGLYPPEAIAVPADPAGDLGDVPAIAVKTQPQPLAGLPLLGREPPGLVRDPATRRRMIAAYQACTTFADAQVGVVLRALDRLDLWRDTVVVLMGDNGFHLGEHAGLLRKDTLFEEALHVPLIVAAPGLRPAVVRAPVEVLDVYPTIVELAGLPPVGGLDARSLGPLLANPGAAGRRPALSYRRVQPPERAWSLRTPRLRYTLWPDGSEELYEVEAGEAANLARDSHRAAEKAALRRRLQALLDAHPPVP